jgi:hypothetical protein
MFSVVIGLAACGGDDPSTGGGSCSPNGQMSTPGATGDPCQQNDSMCVAIKGMGVAPCVDGKWGQCVCMTPPAATPPAGASGATGGVTTCGNNILDQGEACERGVSNSMTCESMYGKGATGLVMCDSTCKFNFAMCVPPKMTGAAGSGAMVVGGSGAMMGTGGSGR